jgi:hypothetical protein
MEGVLEVEDEYADNALLTQEHEKVGHSCTTSAQEVRAGATVNKLE